MRLRDGMASLKDGGNSPPSSLCGDPEADQRLSELFAAKQRRRLELARLPIEEKIRILVELQKIAYDIHLKTGRQAISPWLLSDG